MERPKRFMLGGSIMAAVGLMSALGFRSSYGGAPKPAPRTIATGELYDQQAREREDARQRNRDRSANDRERAYKRHRRV